MKLCCCVPGAGVGVGEIVSGPLSPTILVVILVAIVIVFAVGLVVLVAESYQIVDCRHEGFIVNPLLGS